jgi:hypothetical protein
MRRVGLVSGFLASASAVSRPPKAELAQYAVKVGNDDVTRVVTTALPELTRTFLRLPSHQHTHLRRLPEGVYPVQSSGTHDYVQRSQDGTR